MTRRSTVVRRLRRCLFTLLLAFAALPACADSDRISGAELVGKLESSAPPLVLDVRSSSEFASGHVPGAVNVPHDELPQRLDDLTDTRDREIVVYCERGGRAGVAESALRTAGFTQVFHLEGDMAAWRKSGRPVAQPDPSAP